MLTLCSGVGTGHQGFHYTLDRRQDSPAAPGVLPPTSRGPGLYDTRALARSAWRSAVTLATGPDRKCSPAAGLRRSGVEFCVFFGSSCFCGLRISLTSCDSFSTLRLCRSRRRRPVSTLSTKTTPTGNRRPEAPPARSTGTRRGRYQPESRLLTADRSPRHRGCRAPAMRSVLLLRCWWQRARAAGGFRHSPRGWDGDVTECVALTHRKKICSAILRGV